jgi:hypothetical protein
MKIGEWDTTGGAGAIMLDQLAQLGATEDAAHVAVAENGRLRILVATDIGLLDYHYHPAGADPEGPWSLRGELLRWSGVRGLRLQMDAQIEEDNDTVQARWIWRFVAEEPRIDLMAESSGAGERAPGAVLPLARACLQHAR